MQLAYLAPHLGKINQIRFCPEATDLTPTDVAVLATDSGSAWGGDFYPWSWLGNAGSYGMNLWLEPACIVGNTTFYPSGYQYGFNQTQDTIYLPDPSSTTIPTFADCNWVGGFPLATDQPTSNLSTGGQGNPGNLPRFCLDRHGKITNVAFVDGHAESVSLAGLWQLTWNATFTPQTVKVP